MEAKINFEEKIRGGIVGLLVGDALGVPYEFNPPEKLPPLEKIEFEPPAGFNRTYPYVPTGTWSDDGAQALCLLASLLECGRFDADDFAQKLIAWCDEDYMAVGKRFDIGIQTQRAISNLKQGFPPLEAGPSDEHANGNGSLMRVLPLALWHKGSDEELVKDAFNQSSLTHGHLRSKLCCALYCLWAKGILNDIQNPWGNAVSTLRKIFGENSEEIAELETQIFSQAQNKPGGSGYVVDSLFSAKWACEKSNYEETVKSAVSLGRDTDTTACIAGGIAGLKYGLAGIPERWRKNLRGAEIYEPLLDKLVEHRNDK
jgi:ADP-ribosylglycohydrolase